MDLDTELDAINWNLINTCNELNYITLKQAKALAQLMQLGLADSSRENRIAVLKLLVGAAMYQIAGVKIVSSTKNLTSPVASFLINLLLEPGSDPWRLSEYGRELLSTAEGRVKEQAGA